MNTSNVKKILIVRTDRIGDVVLSTPVIAATRSAFPGAFIAVMVSPQTKEIVAQNPYLDEVIVYDKKIANRSVFKTLYFAAWLRRKKFDLALILHSTNRISIICFLAGIPKRVGYKRGKMDFLLTDKLEYTKRLGEKHESEYSMDILAYCGVKVKMSLPIMPIKKQDEETIDALLRGNGLGEKQKFIVIHSGASCSSRLWPQERFANVADILTEKFGMKAILVSSSDPGQMKIGEKVRSLMKKEVIFLCGRTSLGELAALLKRASLVVSSDSGPVHIACAVGAPVITIFGRKDKGLSPTRWKGLGAKSIVLHKDVGCVRCLAHNCKKDFLCIKSINVEEVVEKVGDLICNPGAI